MLYDDNTASQTYELFGPKNYSTAEIAELVDREIYKRRRHINMPKALLKPAAGLLNRFIWWDIMSADEVEREFHDQVIDESAKTFKDLGMEPSDISKWTYHYLVCDRSVSARLGVVVADPGLREARVPRHTSTCRLRRRGRCGKRRSTFTCLTTSKRRGLLGSCGGGGRVRHCGVCIYTGVTRRYFLESTVQSNGWRASSARSCRESPKFCRTQAGLPPRCLVKPTQKFCFLAPSHSDHSTDLTFNRSMTLTSTNHPHPPFFQNSPYKMASHESEDEEL